MSTQQVIPTIDVDAASRQFSRIVRALPQPPEASTSEQRAIAEAAYEVAYVADRYADAERLISMVIEHGLDYKRFDATLQPLWEQAYFLTNQPDQMARRGGTVCAGLARRLRELIMKHDRALVED